MPIIINGGSYSDGGWWSNHLQKAETNERVEIVGFANLSAETVPGAFREMEALATGTRCRNYFYQANINPRADELLTPAQRDEAVELLEKNLGFTGQPRFVVEHQKEGRTHWHVVWSRIDTEAMRAIPDSLTAAIHERTSRELEIRFDLERGQSVLTPDREHDRPERRPKKQETFRETGVDPEIVKADARACKQIADNGQSFKTALEASGAYVLARGDRRDFVIIDSAGDDHSLGRRLGMKAMELRAFMADIDPASLLSVAEAKARQHARHPTPEREPQVEHTAGRENDPATARGPYAELRAAQTTSQFEAGATQAAEPRAPIWERDAGEPAWLDAVTSAAIAKDEATSAGKTGRQRQLERNGEKHDRPAAHGPYAALQTPEPALAPKPERELTGTAAEIRMAWAVSRTATELGEALAARGVGLALVSADEAYASERHAALAKAAGNFAPAWREGEIVAIDGRGSVYRLDARTTGDERGEIEGRLVGVDRAALKDVAVTQEAMRAASLAAWIAERKAEREAARPPTVLEARIVECAEQARLFGAHVQRDERGEILFGADALAYRMRPPDERAGEAAIVHGPEAFAARLEAAGIAIVRATAADVLALGSLRQGEGMARLAAETNGEARKPHHFAELTEGQLAAVTRGGDVHRINADKLRGVEIPADLPSVTDARAAFEADRAETDALYAGRRADIAAERDAFADAQELRQTMRAAEHAVEGTLMASAAATDRTLRTGSRVLGGAGKMVEGIVGFLGGLFGGPKLTRQQAHDRAQAEGNEENVRARDYAAMVEAKEAEFDDRMEAEKKARQEQEMSFTARFGRPPSREADIGREHDGRDRERERD